MRKAFRQVPGCPHSRQWGAFAVRNPETQLIELFQHLSLPFGARAAPLLFCAVARIYELVAFHLGVLIVAFVDDFFAVVPKRISHTVFDQFKWFVIDLLGSHLKTKKESPPKSSGMLLGVWVNLLPGGNGEFFLPGEKRLRYLSKVQAVLQDDVLTSGNAAKLAGALSFASSVTLATFGRPFLQPLYGLASGRIYKVDEEAEHVPPQAKRGEKGLHPRVRWALLWWVQILEPFPPQVFTWNTVKHRNIVDLFTDASAEDRWEGLGAVVFLGSLDQSYVLRINDVPKELEPFLPSKSEQKVRIAQLEMLAILLAIRSLGHVLRDCYCRIHVDNVAAMYSCLNGYSGNSYMAR